MFKAVLLQFVATVVAILAASALVGSRGALSAALGGTVIILPNLLFAMRLKLASRVLDASHAGTFLVGVFAKLALTLALLFIVSHWYRDLHWLSLLAGMFLALQSNIFALLMKN
ncbi:MAG: ATP synthase subunit I [Rhodocyclaceae bacterium]|nr:ATP synthase subunit I [Rhodocyclaceae bacterium]